MTRPGRNGRTAPLGLSGLICLCTLAASGPVPAQEKSPDRPLPKAPERAAAAQDAAEAGLAQSKGAKKVLRLEELTIEGRIQKPQAFFILPRSNLNFESGERKESFLPKTQRSLEQEPF